MSQAPLLEPCLEIEEIDQSNNVVATYINSAVGEKGERIDVVTPQNVNSYARSVLNAFLPAGYPHSVTSDYFEYQVYDSLQAFSSSIAGMLSSRAVLKGIGVGDVSASPTAALLLSVLQESTGRIGTILFAHRLGTSLEPECKMYRLSADIFNDAAMILDCLSPAFPKVYRVGILSASSVLRALCGVAAGSSKASLSAHFATQGNLGELNAKDSSQETVISLLGMLAGSIVVSSITSQWATWLSLLFLLAIHLGTNYLAVRAVCMRTLNRQRANLVFGSILQQLSDEGSGDHSLPETKTSNTSILICPTPEQVRHQERIFETDGVLRLNGQVPGYCKIGVPLSTIITSLSSTSSKHTLTHLLHIFSSLPYLIWFDAPSNTYLIVLEEGATTKDQLEAWLFVMWFSTLMSVGICEGEKLMKNLERAKGFVEERKGRVFEALVRSEWDLETGALETRSGVRIRMGDGKKDV